MLTSIDFLSFSFFFSFFFFLSFLQHTKGTNAFAFDRVFDWTISQRKVFEYGAKQVVEGPFMSSFFIPFNIPPNRVTFSTSFFFRCHERLQWNDICIWSNRQWKDLYHAGEREGPLAVVRREVESNKFCSWHRVLTSTTLS